MEKITTLTTCQAELERVQQEVVKLQKEKANLEILLQTIIEHADQLEVELRQKIQTILKEKQHLEMMLLEITRERGGPVETLLSDKTLEATESEKKLVQFLETMPMGIFVVDAKGKLFYINQKAQQILSQEIIKELVIITQLPSVSQIYLANSNQIYPVSRLPIVRALQGESAAVDDIELHQLNKVIPLEMWATPIMNEQGVVQYAIAAFQDITLRKRAELEKIGLIKEREAKQASLQLNTQIQKEIQERHKVEAALRKAHQELDRLATLDSLTQVANHRYLDEYLKQEWQRLSRVKAPLSLILCNIDYFKQYNDTYGSTAGDECLQQVAQAMCRAVKRLPDLVARYGGEEFAVVLPNTDADGAVIVASAIRWEVKMLRLAYHHSPIGQYVTLSIGVASIAQPPERDMSAHALVTLADMALYEAKAQGRNRIILKTFESPAKLVTIREP
ncbi:diguanylate cyclase (GGDEF) domain-containing protein [Thioploca ingrica]|uniref:diguanylate cyclase n=1 Tax=Thioploca ingrica TaxID=40754 RepID=A0A090AMU6_9GAMM|nr:diguanylate cyclase (GGDEF) domain-containing protein [Thioploca ingrica]